MKKIVIALAMTAFIAACSMDGSDFPSLEVGQGFTDSNVRVLVLDSFTVKMSTFKFDSINTSSSERLLVGKYKDDFFGEVESSAFFELTRANTESTTNIYDLPEDAELDSVALILGYDGYFYNDTTAVSQINVHVIQEDVEPEDNIFYNTSTLKFDSVPLVSRNYLPEPFDEDSLHISVPFEFGENIFDLLQNNDINDTDELRDVFKGFALRPGPQDNTAVIGFSRGSDNTYLRFFYSVPEEFEDDELSFDLVIDPFQVLPTAFNSISSQPDGTDLQGLTDQEIEISSTDSRDLAYIQSGTGYAVKVEFPSIKNIFDIQGSGTLLQATLRIKPLRTSYNEFTTLRDSLVVSFLDRNNLAGAQLQNSNGSIFGRLVGENEEFLDVTYEIPVDRYIDFKLNEVREGDDALVLFLNEFNSSVSRVVLQGEENRDFEASLELTYAIYDDE
ncbi:hypothetical protein HME9304_01376 [Flagellimonas maritima]|uniref:DUF4270 family protein n=1 Tax=Flagellimonas maritima TaxID=1383885 RepID=A0A2Z4LRB3_9FLAO|nr:DUF4270 family protein [Allomuricauda aurantiaca]AWX44376.1 hypothetical protein HME9304_01376 [Allomuricauda aurantiaca]